MQAVGDFAASAAAKMGSFLGSVVEKIATPTSRFTSLGKGGLPGLANGTSNFAGGLAIVGEQGPELVDLPTGSAVIPNDRIGGGGVTVNVTGNVVRDEQALADKIEEQLNTRQERNQLFGSI